MSSTYVGVTALPRYVIRTQTRGRTYYYFRRRPFLNVRLPGELGSVLFTDTYTAALRATNLEEFTALRKHMQEQHLVGADEQCGWQVEAERGTRCRAPPARPAAG